MTAEAIDLNLLDDERTLLIRPVGCLDAAMGKAMLRAAARAASVPHLKLLVDLGGLNGYTPDAIVAVTGCRRLAQQLPTRVRIVADGSIGAEAMRRSRTVAP